MHNQEHSKYKQEKESNEPALQVLDKVSFITLSIIYEKQTCNDYHSNANDDLAYHQTHLQYFNLSLIHIFHLTYESLSSCQECQPINHNHNSRKSEFCYHLKRSKTNAKEKKRMDIKFIIAMKLEVLK